MTLLDTSEAVSDRNGPSLLEQANAAYDSGDYGRSLSILDEAISSGAETEVILNNKGATLDSMGRGSEAVESYRRAVARAPGYELAWHNLGNSLLGQAYYDAAARAYRRAAALNPGRPENLSGLAVAYAKMGKLRRARATVKMYLKAAVHAPSAHMTAAGLYLDFDLAEDALVEASAHLRAHPDSKEAHALMATALHESGDYAKAVDAFGKALEMDPGDKELLNNMGYSLFCHGSVERALECFDRALEIDAGYKHAWYNKGYCLHGSDRLAEAVVCYTRAVEIDPDDRVLWNNLGNALYNLGRFAESIPKFVEALRVDPDYEIAWNNIGNALEKLGMWQEAVPYHDRALEVRPDFDYALFAKGTCLGTMGQLEEGYDLVMESLGINPLYDESWRAKARIAGLLGRWDEALSAIEEALLVNPSFAEGWADRGDILTATGDHEGARTSYETALKFFPSARNGSQNEVSLMLRKAEVLMRLGHPARARDAVEVAMSAGIHDPSVLSRCVRVLRLSGGERVPEGLSRIVLESEDPSLLLSYAELLLYLDMHDEALECLGLVVSDDHRGRATYLKARTLASAGRLGDELSSLVSSLSGWEASKLRGEIAEQRGDLRTAGSEYSRALEARPSDYSSAESLARVRLCLGMYREALDAADLAVGIDPSEPGAALLAQRIRSARWAAPHGEGRRRNPPAQEVP